MIDSIKFGNYKCLDGKEFKLNKVNVFAGYNGRGKSSVLQSVLMLSQSVHADADIEKLHVNGDMVALGDYSELLTDSKNENIILEMDMRMADGEKRKVELTYAADVLEDVFIGKLVSFKVDGSEQFAVVQKADDTGSDGTESKASTKTPQWLKDQFRGINYVSADRQGPVKYVERREKPSVHILEPHGRNAINILNTYKENVEPEMNLKDNDTARHKLAEQVSCWMSHIMCDDQSEVEVPDKDVADGRKKNSVLSLEYKINDRNFSSYHVGFGYSYILSIIEAALIAKRGSIVIVENPEAHLHAQAQSRLTQLLSKLASRGVQVFVETHSEHIVNGFRLAALRKTGNLTNEDLSIFFFDKNFEVKELHVERDGKIKNWPNGFFDQAKNDLAEIIKLGAKVAQA